MELKITPLNNVYLGKDLSPGMIVHMKSWSSQISYGLVVKQVVSNMFNGYNFHSHENLAIFLPETNEVCIITKSEMYNHIGNFEWSK